MTLAAAFAWAGAPPLAPGGWRDELKGLRVSRDAVAAKDRGKPGLPLGWVNPFDAEDADVAHLKIGDKLADGVRAEIYGGQIERHVLTGKKALRAPKTGVEIR